MNSTASTPAHERVAALFRAARDLVREDLSSYRVLRLPTVTAAGLEVVHAVLRARPDLSVMVGRIQDRAAAIPAASRRRRVLTALAKWLPGVPCSIRDQESWFGPNVVRAVALATAGTATEAEVAGFIALTFETSTDALLPGNP